MCLVLAWYPMMPKEAVGFPGTRVKKKRKKKQRKKHKLPSNCGYVMKQLNLMFILDRCKYSKNSKEK